MTLKIIVPKGKTYPSLYVEDGGSISDLPYARPWLSEEELAAATIKFPVVCTDVVLVDERNRFVLAKRKHACAAGWWWKGGRLECKPDAGRESL